MTKISLSILGNNHIKSRSLGSKPERAAINPGKRQKIVDFIEGRRKVPPPMLSTKVRENKIAVCELTDGAKIDIAVSLAEWEGKNIQVNFLAEQDRILAKVARPGSTGSETYLIKEGGELYPGGKLLHQTAGLKRKARVQAQRKTRSYSAKYQQAQAVIELNAQISKWWEGKTDLIPPNCRKKVDGMGTIHLCSIRGEKIELYVGWRGAPANYADLSFKEENDSRLLISICGNRTREFWLTYEGKINIPPVLRSSNEK